MAASLCLASATSAASVSLMLRLSAQERDGPCPPVDFLIGSAAGVSDCAARAAVLSESLIITDGLRGGRVRGPRPVAAGRGPFTLRRAFREVGRSPLVIERAGGRIKD